MTVALLAALAIVPVPFSAPEKRWLYLSTNLLVDANVDKGLETVRRAAKAGYNGVLVSDSKFMRWDDLPERYATNVRRFRRAVKESHMELVAAVAPIGYSNDLLCRDPDLAEGLPVVDAPFVAGEDGRLSPRPDDAGLKNGGFDAEGGPAPSGWNWVDSPGKVCVLDTDVKSGGRASLRMDPADGGNARAVQVLDVKPFSYYHLRLSVKTKGLKEPGNVNVTVLGKSGRSLQHRSLPIKADMDWTPMDVTFNSLSDGQVSLYVGVWGHSGGQIWWDDVSIERGGLVNLVRRSGAPFTVTSEDGTTRYQEGRDFEGAKDPKTGRVAWPGDYDVWHDGPTMTVPSGSRIKAGQTVLVDYCHTALIYDGQVTCCLGEPKVMEAVTWQIGKVKDNLAPDGYMLSHDEIRVGGWDLGCTRDGLSPGALLARNVRDCTTAVRKADPGKPVYVWSDMFDPFHNAATAGKYYLVNGDGPWKDSWKGLDKDVTVVNWNMGQDRKKAIGFFVGLKTRQILAGYYDGGGTPIAQWMSEAGRPYGVMYTTWRGDFSGLEQFAKDAGFFPD
ncbi:MAG: hypothetical protein JST30_08835 [Armatimonadetes bacterium]|nr:hypothetical protein [Armatimonadota bacterium]